MELEGEPTPLHRLDGEAARNYAAYTAIRADLDLAHRIATRLLEEMGREHPEGDPLVEALYTAASISYARAFSEGRRLHRLSEQDVDVEPNALLAHRAVMKMRNQHIAHSVLPFEEVAVGVMLDPDEDAIVGVGALTIRRVSDDANGVRNLLYLAEILSQKLTVLLDDQLQLVQDEASAIGFPELRNLPTLGYKAPGLEVETGPAAGP